MHSEITNLYGQAHTTKLSGQHVLIHKADWQHSYSHHAHLTSQNGKLLATWSIGVFHEDGPGQRMVLATSTDGGITWSTPQTIVDAVPGEHRPTCVTAAGLYVSEEGIAAFYSSFDHTLEGLLNYAASGANNSWQISQPTLQDVYSGVLVSRDGGETWRNTGTRIPGLIINLGPIRLNSGRLILHGHRMLAYSDHPAGTGPWTVTGLPGLPEGYYERAGGHLPITADWRHLGVCENCIHQVPGAALRLLFRSSKGQLAVSESHDDGATWSTPRLTDYTDCGSRFQFGRLPDGRFFALNCPDNTRPDALLRRTPLILAVSKDGTVFDRHFILGDEADRPLRFPGAYKHGRYGYPCAHVMDGSLYIINSVAKEDIELHIFDLRDLDS